MTRGAFVGRVWLIWGLMSICLVGWVFTVPDVISGGGLWPISDRLAAALFAAFFIVVGLLAAVFLSVSSLMPSYRTFLIMLGAAVLAVGIFWLQGRGTSAAMESTLQLSYALLPFAVAGGALYGEKVRAHLRTTILALVPPMLWYGWLQVAQVPVRVVTPGLWPFIVVGDLVVIALFYWRIKEPVQSEGM